MTCIRLSHLLGTLALAAFAGADTPTPWGNPLIRDVPATAKGLVSIDLSGSSKPLAAVLSLAQTASGKSIGENLAQALKLLNLPDDVAAEFAKSTNQRAVIYYDPSAEKNMTQAVVLVLGLKPGKTMSTVLKASEHDQDGVKYADFNGIDAHTEGNVLLLTPSSKNLPNAVKPLRGGNHLSLATLNRVSDAIEPASEIAAWMDSDTSTSAQAGNNFTVSTGKSFGLSIGLHPKGLSISAGPLSFAMSGKPLDLTKLRPLPAHYLSTLPGGAYFVTCMANPWPAAEQYKLLNNLPEEMTTSINSMKSMIRGDYVIGLYPSKLKDGKPKGIDLLLELRPNEGNNPAAQLKKLMNTVSKAFIPGDPPVFESFKVEGADQAYRLNKGVASLLHLALKSGLESVGASFDSLIKNKNLVIAGVGKNVVFATSVPVLRKAVAALKFGRSPLSADPKFSELNRDRDRPTQFVLAASIGRILDLASDIAKGLKKDGKPLIPSEGPMAQLKDVMALWPDPVMVRLSIINNGLSARLFIPIGFDALKHGMKKAGLVSR